MDWDKLRIFHAVADAGSLTHAGEVLHLSQSAVSRQIRALEENLHTTLFHRHARGLILTEQGELLFQATFAMNSHLEAAEAYIRDVDDEPKGQLRVTAPMGLGTLWLVPRLPSLLSRYPDLNVDLILKERVLNLAMREADVAIRMKEPSQADLIRKRLMSVRIRLYASPEYLEQNGTPKRLEDLEKHRLICQNSDTPQVSAGAALIEYLLGYNIHTTLRINNYFGVLQGVQCHLGIGLLPDYIVQDQKDIQRVLPDVESNEVPVYLAYPEELRHSKRVAAFRDFVVEEIATLRREKARNKE